MIDNLLTLQHGIHKTKKSAVFFDYGNIGSRLNKNAFQF